jgi:hypothetical protein
MESLEKQWKEYLKENKGFSGAAKAAFENYEAKYEKPNPKFPVEEDFKTKVLVPGKIYTFTYLNDKKTSIKHPYIDLRPIFISTGRLKFEGKVLESGINLGYIPPKIRIPVLERLYKAFKTLLEINYKYISEGKQAQKTLPITYSNISSILKGTGFETAFTSYDRSKMQNIAIIDYDDWVSTIALDTKSILGAPTGEVYKEYIKGINKPITLDRKIKNQNTN